MISYAYFRRIARILCCCLFLCSLGTYVYARKTNTNYREAAVSAFSTANDTFAKTRFHEAYEYCDQTVSAARRAINFEGLTAEETQQMKDLIRQADNKKQQIMGILRHFKVLISEKKIARGMTPEQVQASWGEPQDIKKNLYQAKETQEWRYGDVLTDNDKYVFFSNGIVEDWADKTKK